MIDGAAKCGGSDRDQPAEIDQEPTRAVGDGPAMRQCMACGERFASEGWHHRLCRRCTKRSQAPTIRSLSG